jgi:hypothetical protein
MGMQSEKFIMGKKNILALIGAFLLLGLGSPALSRLINPDPRPESAESSLDRYFPIAFVSAVSGDFDTSMPNYQRAMNAATDKCDCQHAMAGFLAAKGAKQILKVNSWGSKPTQHFYSRLRTFTEDLKCVTVR